MQWWLLTLVVSDAFTCPCTGTSLSVAPMDSLLTFFPPTVPKVLINKTRVKLRKAVRTAFAAELLGFADSVVRCPVPVVEWNWCVNLRMEFWPLDQKLWKCIQSCPHRWIWPSPLNRNKRRLAPTSRPLSGEVGSTPRHLAPTLFLFEGADEDQIRSSMSSDPKPADDFVEVVTCDSCSGVISGDA